MQKTDLILADDMKKQVILLDQKLPASSLPDEEQFDITKNFEKFEQYYQDIYQYILRLFPQFKPKVMEELPIFIHRSLIYQLIWTTAYLLEWSALDNLPWLRANLDRIKTELNKIVDNMRAANPLLVERVNNLLVPIASATKPEDWANWFLRWSENLVSLGGSLVRDVGKLYREKGPKIGLITRSFKIAADNDFILELAEEYKLHRGEITFFRSIAPELAAQNRLHAIKKLQAALELQPKREGLLLKLKKIEAEQKEFEAKEAHKASLVKPQIYKKVQTDKSTRLQKARMKMDIETVERNFSRVAEKLFLNESEIYYAILLKLKILKKTLSKTYPLDSVVLEYKSFTARLNKVSEVVAALEPMSSVSMGDAKSMKATSGVDESKVYSLDSSLGHSIEQKLTSADPSQLSLVKVLRDEYFAAQAVISIFSDARPLLQRNQKAFVVYMQKVIDNVLDCPPDIQVRRLFGISVTMDEKHIEKTTRFLLSIFHPDKSQQLKDLGITRLDNVATLITTTKDKLLFEAQWCRISTSVGEFTPKLIESIRDINDWIESLINGDGIQQTLATRPNIFNESILRQCSATSASPLLLTF